MDFADLSRLVYRDEIKQKHDARERLALELKGKKHKEDTAKMEHRKTLVNANPGEVDPIAELILDHLLAAN